MIQAIMFDKTGTLTRGSFGVSSVLVLGKSIGRQEVLDYAAAVESRSEHPIGRAIAAAVKNVLPATGFRSIPGEGVEATVNGRKIQVVSPVYVRTHSPLPSGEAIEQLQALGETVVYVLIDGIATAAIGLADTVRPESRQVIGALKEMGIRCIMLTGDDAIAAARVANEIGIDEYFAGVLPGEKALKVKEVQSRGMIVGMVGDGVNDAPALAQADVGMAIGAGTDVAIATADIVLVRSNPLDVVEIMRLGRATYRKMVQNLIWATGYNVLAIPLAAGVLFPLGVLLSPAVGAVLMSVSTVVVALNARTLGNKFSSAAIGREPL